MTIAYPFIDEKFWAENDLVSTGPPIGVARECGVSEAKCRLAIATNETCLVLEEPPLNQSQSVDGSLPWVSQMFRCPLPPPYTIYLYFQNRTNFKQNRSKILDAEHSI